MRRRSRISNFTGGVLGTLAVAIVVLLVFGGLPLPSHPFVLRAMFTSQTQLHIPSPVRISGVDVGQVVSVTRVSSSSDAGEVAMDIDSNGLPIHSDATVEIRPRIFLEGNFYVDLHPGSPGAPVLRSGETLPAANTAGPVQIDRVLASLTTHARQSLQTLLQGIGSSLNAPPSPREDATQDPIVDGLTGGQALNLALKYSTDAFRASAIVNEATLGTAPHDLSGVVRGTQQIFHGLEVSGSQLASFVTTFNDTMRALASRQQDLAATIAVLPAWLRNTESALGPLNASFPPTREFARAILPGLRQLDPTIGVALPWIAQATALFSKPELGNLLASLSPAVDNTASALGSTKSFISQADVLARCFSNDLIPTGNEVIQDPPVGTGLQLYQELFQGAVGLAGASQNFDGNGRYIRTLAGGGSIEDHSSSIPGEGPLYGNFVLQPLGTRPAWPGKAPAVKSSVPCYRNAPPNLNSAQTGATP
jgi:ABC-type transporter Mla subunit MlaD